MFWIDCKSFFTVWRTKSKTIQTSLQKQQYGMPNDLNNIIPWYQNIVPSSSEWLLMLSGWVIFHVTSEALPNPKSINVEEADTIGTSLLTFIVSSMTVVKLHFDFKILPDIHSSSSISVTPKLDLVPLTRNIRGS